MFANCAISVAACSAPMLVAMSRPDTTCPNSSSSSIANPSCAPSACMSRICEALTALVRENSMAASLSAWYCSSVPSTVLRTLVRFVSMSTAAATVAAPAARTAGVSVRESLPPIDSIISPAGFTRLPKLSSPSPSFPMAEWATPCSMRKSASALLAASRLLLVATISRWRLSKSLASSSVRGPSCSEYAFSRSCSSLSLSAWSSRASLSFRCFCSRSTTFLGSYSRSVVTPLSSLCSFFASVLTVAMALESFVTLPSTVRPLMLPAIRFSPSPS